MNDLRYMFGEKVDGCVNKWICKVCKIYGWVRGNGGYC